MVKLRQYKLGDEIWTRPGGRWKTPFIVEVIYKGWIVAVNRKLKSNPQFLFIRTYTNEVYNGSSRFMKYGVNSKTSIKGFIDGIIRGEYKLEKDTCTPIHMMLADTEFDIPERREQVHYGE